jgi:hypothetical protein
MKALSGHGLTHRCTRPATAGFSRSQAGELKRWATAEYEASIRDAVHIGITEHTERVPHVRFCGRCAGRAAGGYAGG